MATSRFSQAPAVDPHQAAASGYLEAGGQRIHWEEHGEAGAAPVALLHHGLGSVRAWRAQVPALVAAGYRVLAYDRWGYGRSSPRPFLDAPAFVADRGHLAALMDERGVDRAALVGHSDGGTLALYFAADHPDRVSRLIAVAAHIYLEARMGPGLQEVAHQFDRDGRFRLGLRRAHGDKAEAVFRNWHDGWYRGENREWNMQSTLADVSCPTLVIQGENDEHATPQHAQDIAAGVRQGACWLIPGIGHMVPQEAAPAFNARLVEFLDPWRMEFEA